MKHSYREHEIEISSSNGNFIEATAKIIPVAPGYIRTLTLMGFPTTVVEAEQSVLEQAEILIDNAVAARQ